MDHIGNIQLRDSKMMAPNKLLIVSDIRCQLNIIKPELMMNLNCCRFCPIYGEASMRDDINGVILFGQQLSAAILSNLEAT